MATVPPHPQTVKLHPVSPKGEHIPLYDEYTARLSLADTDAFQVLFWGAPLRWAQVGFENLAERAGHPVAETLAGTHDHPVVHASVDYKKPLRLGDFLRIHTEIVKVGTTSFTIETNVHDAEGDVAVVVRRVQVATDRVTGPIPVDDWIREAAVAHEHSNDKEQT